MLSRRRAVFAAVSFSKVTVAFCVSPVGVISMVVILPLCRIMVSFRVNLVAAVLVGRLAYQKEKKSLTSFSLVFELMFVT